MNSKIPTKPHLLSLTVDLNDRTHQKLFDDIQCLRREAQAIGSGYAPPTLVAAEGTILLRAYRNRIAVAHRLEVSRHHYRWEVDSHHMARCIEQPGWLGTGGNGMAVFLGAVERFLGRWLNDLRDGTVSGAPSVEGDATAFLNAVTDGQYLAHYRKLLVTNAVTHAETARHGVPATQAAEIRATAQRVREAQRAARQREVVTSQGLLDGSPAGFTG